jgi:4'-phosphopantetheinyl transferase
VSGSVIETVCVDLDRAALAGGESMLDAAERARAAAFRFERDRRRFIARRVALRVLLGRRLGRAPEIIRYTANRFGKPRLAKGGLAFNASHARGIALFAFSAGREVGCDIAWCDPDLPVLDLAAHCLTPAERRDLARLPPAERPRAFVAAWAVQEAYGKARGSGLAEAPLAPEAGWSVRRFAPLPGFCAAVAATGADWRLAPVIWEADF